MEFHLRPASESDKEFLYSLHCATMRAAIEKTWGWDEDWQRRDFEQRFRGQLVSIIDAGGRDSGGLWLESSPELIYVSDLQVLPEMQNLGIGTSVLKDLIAQATARDVPLELVVLKVNPRARSLYERLGFTVTGENDPFIHMRWETRAA